MKYKFIIFTPSYSENNGGSVTLHHLCDLINKNGYECYLYPAFDNLELNLLNYKIVLLKFFKRLLRQPLRKFKTSTRFNTPVMKKIPNNFDEWIIIYPEITFGNPLGGRNIVRWLLHNPGFFSGKIYYGSNEIYFKYTNQYNEFNYINSKTSKNTLYIFTYLKKYYNEYDWSYERSGSAYCIRKGRISSVPFDLEGAIKIDGMKHKEISRIFKKVKYFISFDLNTAFSRFAALCGCISVVVPVEGVTKEDWQPDIEKRYGVSYGFEDENIKEALSTLKHLSHQILMEEKDSVENVANFISEVEMFFTNRNHLKNEFN